MRWTDHHYLDLDKEHLYKKVQVVEPVITVESIAAKFLESKLGLGLKLSKPVKPVIEPKAEPVIESEPVNVEGPLVDVVFIDRISIEESVDNSDIQVLSALSYPGGTEVIVKYENEVYRIVNKKAITPYNVELLSRIISMEFNYILIR